MDPVLLIPIDRAWVEEREALLLEQENAMVWAARDRATTDEERAYWDDFIALRDVNPRKRVNPNR